LIQTSGQPGILGMPDHTKPPIAIGCDGVRTPVARSIIDHDEFEVGMALAQDAFDRRTEKSSAVVDGHEDCDLVSFKEHRYHLDESHVVLLQPKGQYQENPCEVVVPLDEWSGAFKGQDRKQFLLRV